MLNSEETRLLQALTEEALAVQQFVDLLSLEQKALSAGNTDDLPTLVEKKTQLAGHLNHLAEQRNVTLAALGFSADRAGIEAWCVQHPAEQVAGNTWVGILKLAHEARELNRVNGELIQLRMNATFTALEALRASKSSLDLYGPDGQSAKPGHRRINQAV